MTNNLLERLQRISERLKRDYHAQKVILYGSHAAGTATEESDIDLLIIAPARERFFERMASVRKLIRDIRKGLPLSPIVLTPDEVEERNRKGDRFVQEIFEGGIPL